MLAFLRWEGTIELATLTVTVTDTLYIKEHQHAGEGEPVARAECAGPARPPAPLDDGQRRRLCSLIATIADRDIPLKPYFQDYELVAKNDGRVTFAHFARLLAHVGIVVPVEDFHLLVRRFAADSYSVDYVKFLEAIEEARRHGLKGLGPEYRNPRAVLDTTLPKNQRPEVERGASTASLGGSEIFHPAINRAPPFERPIIDIMLRIQQFVVQRRIRFSEFFRDYDPLNSGRIPPLSFRRGLDLAGLAGVLSEHETACLIRHYLDPNDPERVCWRTFEDDCDQVFTVKELEKHPDLVAGAATKAALASVPTRGSAEERGGPSEEELDNCERALLRLRGAVRERSVDLRSAFRDHDPDLIKVILLHDNTGPRVAKPVKTYLEMLQWEDLPHPPYSPDIAPSDFHLFCSLAHGLPDQRFHTYEEAKKWIDSWIASKDMSFFRCGIHILLER
ncbi:Mariner Mos1 transposase [Eumeta japonica]|uniref:Mariner Mos1 transposase n=1 Tax=Eumeta variegata TaxID=151549 RepID=A0A4C1WB95_EUMVA|nr:Mariner Mos1 transposase [Eumeta japonica]